MLMRIQSATANAECNRFDEFESEFLGNEKFNWRKHVRWHQKSADFSSNVRNGTIPDRMIA